MRRVLSENVGLVRPVDFVRMTGPPDEKPSVVGGGVSAAVSYGLDDGFGRQPYLPAKRLTPYVDRLVRIAGTAGDA